MRAAGSPTAKAHQRRSFAGVCAGHALLLWALLQLAPQAATGPPQRGPVSVALLAAPARTPTSAAVQPTHAPDPARPATAQPQSTADKTVALAAASGALQAETPTPIPGHDAAPVPASAEPAVLAAALLATVIVGAAAPPPQALAAAGAEAAAVTTAQADRRYCAQAPHPAALRERGIEGAVTLRVKVDASGRAADVQLLSRSGWRLFDEAALQQARSCRFFPAQRGGQAVDSWVEFPVRFALNSG